MPAMEQKAGVIPTRHGMDGGRGRPVLGQLLLARGLVSQEGLEAALREQQRTGELVGAILIRQGVLTEGALLPILAEQLGIPSMRLEQLEAPQEALARVPVKLAIHYTILPLRWESRRLHLAMANPFNVQRLDELKLLLGCEVKPVLASAQDIREAIQRHYGLGAEAIEHLLDEAGHDVPMARSHAEDLTAAMDEASMASFVNELILRAVQDRATDIHIEPRETSTRIRTRIDGILYETPVPPGLVRLHQAVVSRIKVMAHLDITERRLPQDGRITVRLPVQRDERQADLNGHELDLRISILPTCFGESVDIRLLASRMLYSLEQLGLTEDHLRLLSTLIARPHGIIFVTGPTGSGKTTTLYACLSKLNVSTQKILTIEDPVEYQLPGITQIQVHPKIGLSFAQGLRSMLRHDPDIMMVGEVRDSETAEITIRSALTGHLVFSTLHTNDAAGGITRLLDMGIEPYLLASSVLGFIAQRLVRVVCRACHVRVPPAPELRGQFGLAELPAQLIQGRGCPACKGTGYSGRTAIYEFLIVDEPIQSLILRRASSQEVRRAAQQHGMRTLRQDGWLKILQGVTTPQEVLRVT